MLTAQLILADVPDGIVWLGLATSLGCAVLAAVGWIARVVVEWRGR